MDGIEPQAVDSTVWIEFTGAPWARTEPVARSLVLTSTALSLRQELQKDGLIPVPDAAQLVFADTLIPDEATFLSQGVLAGATITCLCDDGFAVSVLLLDRRQTTFRVWPTEKLSVMLERATQVLRQTGVLVDESTELNLVWFLYVVGAMSLVRLSPTADEADGIVHETPGLSPGCILVMEKSRRELTTYPIGDYEWLKERCNFDCCGVHGIAGKFLVPCGEVPEGKYRAIMGALLGLGMFVLMLGLWQPCLTSIPSGITFIGYFALLLPGMIMVGLICCGNEFALPVKPIGPVDLVLVGLQPAVWWACAILALVTLSFICLVVTDVLWYDCIDGTASTMQEKDGDSAEKNTLFDVAGYIVGGGAFCMTCLGVKWIKTEHVDRMEEAENYDYDSGDWRLIGLLEAGLPATQMAVGIAVQPQLPQGVVFNVANVTQQSHMQPAQELEAAPPEYTPHNAPNPMHAHAEVEKGIHGIPMHAHDLRGSWRSPASSPTSSDRPKG